MFLLFTAWRAMTSHGEPGRTLEAARRSPFRWFSPGVVGLLMFLIGTPVWAMDCPACGARELGSLHMLCPDCQAPLTGPDAVPQAASGGTLLIEVVYLGDALDSLPDEGTVLISGKKRGTISLIEKEARDPLGDAAHHRGLGRDFTARYRWEGRQMAVGVFKVEIEMVFKRYRGWVSSRRRVSFPYVEIKAGEKTAVRHEFGRVKDFPKVRKPGQPEPRKEKVSPVRFQTATGTYGLDVPAF